MNTDTPKISVIVPVYKVEKYLHKCVNSILAQTYGNLEIILVDDGSPDNCGKICDEYAEKDNRIKVIHKLNGGLSDARNAGIRVASGEWIGCIDSDDYIAPAMFETLLNQALQTNSDMSVCQAVIVEEDQKAVFENSTVIHEINNPLEALICQNAFSVNAWNKLYKHSLFTDIEYPVGVLYEDLATTYKLVAHCDKVVVSDAKLYAYVQRCSSIMGQTRFKMHTDKVYIIREMWEYITKKEKIDSEEYFHGMIEYCISDVFNMLGCNSWKQNDAYRLELKRLVYEKQKLIFGRAGLSVYRKTVLWMALYFPYFIQTVFNMKKR